MSEEINKEIVALSDVEHVRLRTGMYIGSVEPIEEECRIIKDGIITSERKMISTGFYKLLNEIIDNSFDEAKRNASKKCDIIVKFNSDTNRVTVSDTGGGFLNASKINPKTGKSNVETALSNLRAGSNFTNDNISATILGTNGVGASCVNMLSDEFEVTTTNDKEVYHQKWVDFKTVEQESKKKTKADQRGTTISFIPLKSIFKNCKWDYDYVVAQMIFREYVRTQDPLTANVTFRMFWDDNEIDLKQHFIPENAFSVSTKLGTVHIWKFEEGMYRQTGFVNTSLCIGTHMNIFQDFMNELFDYKYSWLYWCCAITLNLPPKMVKFDDQNKRKLVSSRLEVEPEMEKHFLNQFKKEFKKTELYKEISKRIVEEKMKDESKELKRQMKVTKKRLVSDKYFAPSDYKGSLCIVEGNCVEENEQVVIINDSKIEYKSLKDVNIGDHVITHRGNVRVILDKQYKLKDCIEIKTKNDKIICSKEHPIFIFNTEKQDFMFIKAKDIDMNIHKIVKNRLSNFIDCSVVIKTEDIGGEYPIFLEFNDGSKIFNTPKHKYCVYRNQKFEMVESCNIIPGDKIAKFTNIGNNK